MQKCKFFYFHLFIFSLSPFLLFEYTYIETFMTKLYLKKSQQPLNNQRNKRLLWLYQNEMKNSTFIKEKSGKFPKSKNREKKTISSLHLSRILWGTFSYIILVVYGNHKTSIWRTHSLNSFFLCLRRTFFSEISKKNYFLLFLYLLLYLML